jgi:putative nucleotidyltransferase with HDIG domain
VVKRTIRLRGISGPIKGQVWESDSLLRAGRLASLEIVLDDSSVSRKHAEVRIGLDGNWTVHDLGSTNGTYVNGTRVEARDYPLRPRDVLQFGKVALMVELLDATLEGPSSDQLVVAAAARSSFDDGLRRMAFDRNSMPRAGDQLMALLRAGHHLVHLESEDQLLDSILNDAVSVLDAQRGAIVLADGEGSGAKLRLRALAVGGGESKGRFHFSKRLTARCFAQGESVLFQNVQNDQELLTQSVSDGAMSSVLCVLLRTPRRKLGVLHLDRGFFQAPFTEDDLHLADAMAAHVSAGIECAQLLRKQRDLFLRTIMTLAQMVELRDSYTGRHTERVSRYAVMLAEKLELPDDQIELVRLGTPLHDIGKIGIPDEILQAPRRLTPQEFARMQTHTTLGAEYLYGIPELHPVIPIVRHHHERWDGTGYPDRLAKDEIPLLARIVAVADAFDAMTTSRPYHENRQGRPAEAAFAEVERQAGRQFDPRCAAAFLEIRDQVVRTMVELMPDAAQAVHATSGAATVIGITATPPPSPYDSSISTEHPFI